MGECTIAVILLIVALSVRWDFITFSFVSFCLLSVVSHGPVRKAVVWRPRSSPADMAAVPHVVRRDSFTFPAARGSFRRVPVPASPYAHVDDPSRAFMRLRPHSLIWLSILVLQRSRIPFFASRNAPAPHSCVLVLAPMSTRGHPRPRAQRR